jgi:hypothetical protein
MPSTEEVLQKIISAKHCEGHTWAEIGRAVGLSGSAARCRYARRDNSTFPLGYMPVPCPICDPYSTDFSFKEGLNTAELRARLSDDKNIHTLEDLLVYCNVNLDVWKIYDWGVKQWAVGAKDKRGELNWENGKIVDGHLAYSGVSVTPLWSVWAKFVRRKPVAVIPEIHPIVATIERVDTPAPERAGVKWVLIGADGHIGYVKKNMRLVPFHNRRVVHAFLQVAQFLQPEIIVLDGDWTDCAELSDKYLRDPNMTGLMQASLAEGYWIRHQLRVLCPHSKIYELEGNHEVRLNKYLIARAPAVYGLTAINCDIPALSFPGLLNLDHLDIEWVPGYPDNELWIADHALIIHGDSISGVPGATARKILEKYEDIKTVFGHTHRRERANQTRRRRHSRIFGEAVGIGTFADLEGPIPAKSKNFNWQNGFGVMCLDEEDAEIYDVGVSQDGSAIWQGLRFHGEDYTPELIRSFPDFNW